MRYKKTNRDWNYRSVTIGNCFSSVWEILPSAVGEILPSAFGVRQYFPNVGETISNSDLNTSHYLCNGVIGFAATADDVMMMMIIDADNVVVSEAEKVAFVAKIQWDQKIMEKESEKKMAEIEGQPTM